VVLRYYAGLPDAEIATHLGCRVPTVRSQISRALATLRIDLTTDRRTYQETP
jgi:DNA-directed RNA polymerase specialized sigma24 family protein